MSAILAFCFLIIFALLLFTVSFGLRFYENRRHVATASQAQVRRPVYRSSIGRWRHYERHLEPLIGRLGAKPSRVPRVARLNVA